MKGAALAFCVEIVDLPGTGNVAGVNEGESTFNVFFLISMSVISIAKISILAKLLDLFGFVSLGYPEDLPDVAPRRPRISLGAKSTVYADPIH